MSALVQVRKKTSLSVTETFSIDGNPVNVDSGLPTLAATFPDGTDLDPLPLVSNSWTGPPARTTGQYRFMLAAQPEVTWLDYELTGTIGGQPQTLGGRVEWIGEYLYNLDDARRFRIGGSAVLSDATKYPNADLLDIRTEITEDFTERGNVSFMPRYARETLDGSGGRELLLEKMLPHKAISVTVGGIAYSAGELADLGFPRGGKIARMSLGVFTSGYRNIVIEYAHGYQQVPPAIRRAALHRATMLLNPSPAGSTVTSWTSPDGTTYSYDRTGQTRGGMVYHYGVPVIDGPLNYYGMTGAGVMA
jgi:hypothetical protein